MLWASRRVFVRCCEECRWVLLYVHLCRTVYAPFQMLSFFSPHNNNKGRLCAFPDTKIQVSEDILQKGQHPSLTLTIQTSIFQEREEIRWRPIFLLSFMLIRDKETMTLPPPLVNEIRTMIWT